jgi:hypothetical protein
LTIYYKDTDIVIGHYGKITGRSTQIEEIPNTRNRSYAGNGGERKNPTQKYKFVDGCEDGNDIRLTCKDCPEFGICITTKKGYE